MKKILLLIIPFIIWGCEKSFNDILDPETSDYQVTGVSSFNSFNYAVGDSAATFFLRLNSNANIIQSYVEIYSPENKKLNSSPIVLYDDGSASHGDQSAGDGIFSNKFPFSQSNLNGSYKVIYYVESKDGNTKQVALHSFIYQNGNNNVAPEISNLVAPDTAEIGSVTLLIFLSVDVADSNGQSDIKMVYFNSFIPPNGNAASNNPFVMLDDGTNGDMTANDGTYSIIIQLPPQGVTKGVYRWEFMARDRGNKLSNIIIHYINIL